jgi:hypothetical protein
LCGGVYQICNRLIVETRKNTCRHRAITQHPEPIREQYEREIVADLRDEDNWLAVTKLSVASKID